MTIEAYLRELGRLLPSTRRTRFLREAESHLRETAAALVAKGVEPGEAERRATEAFGPVEVVARAFCEESARHATRRATVLTLGALILLVLPLYGIPENTLPPATWAVKPADLAWAQQLATGLWLASLAFGVVAVTAAVFDRAPLARAGLALAVAAGAASCLAAGYAAVRWLGEVPGSEASAVLGGSGAVALLAFAGAGLAWATSKREHLPR